MSLSEIKDNIYDNSWQFVCLIFCYIYFSLCFFFPLSEDDEQSADPEWADKHYHALTFSTCFIHRKK